MVSPNNASGPRKERTHAAYYDQLQEQWPAERPSRKKRAYRRKQERRVHVRAERRDAPEPEHISRALLTAQRELAKIQAEADARVEANRADDDQERTP